MAQRGMWMIIRSSILHYKEKIGLGFTIVYWPQVENLHQCGWNHLQIDGAMILIP